MRRLAFGLLACVTGSLFLQSCCPTAGVATGSYGMPVATTETHTKTVQPASYSMPYVPPASIVQAAPMAVSQPMAAPVCQPVQYMQAPAPVAYQANPCQPQTYQSNYCQPSYQASPVCSPSYQSPQYQADPCAPYGYSAGHNVRYNVVGTAQPVNSHYIVVQPAPSQYTAPVHLQAPARASDPCEDTKP